MKSTLTQRLVMALVTVFLLAYVGYQIWRYVTPAYKTETAFTYTVTEVLAVAMRDEAGGLAEILSVLSKANQSLEYAYAFLLHKVGTACLVIRVDDNQAAASALSAAGISVATQQELF